MCSVTAVYCCELLELNSQAVPASIIQMKIVDHKAIFLLSSCLMLSCDKKWHFLTITGKTQPLLENAANDAAVLCNVTLLSSHR